MSVRDTVNEWFRTRLASGPVARDTEAYNQVVGALPALIAQLDPAEVPVEVEPDKPTKGAKPTPVDPPAPSAPADAQPSA
jgi:hypothetical protein